MWVRKYQGALMEVIQSIISMLCTQWEDAQVAQGGSPGAFPQCHSVLIGPCRVQRSWLT